ncbi:MAG TPA: hypothetical protein VGN83_23095 [Falsiroseomonas sp.]|jgi:hypothetical protein|nr:hypothetical protein [Falsiroseomonas sp.]
MTARKSTVPVFAALVGGTMLLATPALAQQGQQGDRGSSRDWVQSQDRTDAYDRYLRQLQMDSQNRGMGESPFPYGSRDRAQRGDMGGQRFGGGGYGEQDRRAMAERYARDQFERGYRAGREEERRQRSGQSSGGQFSGGQAFGGQDRSGGSGSSGGSGIDADYYWVIPDILPDTRFYRGMQDFALIPDYTRPMDRLLIAAQGLREAIQATAIRLPPSDGRDRALNMLHEALIETQQAMVALPPEQRTR